MAAEHEGRPLRFFSANNTLKTYYGPALLRPLSFARGLRCLFGDQSLFCRAADFRWAAGLGTGLPGRAAAGPHCAAEAHQLVFQGRPLLLACCRRMAGLR
jgi:hypothetical protein